MKQKGLVRTACAGLALLLVTGLAPAAAATIWQQDWEDSGLLLDRAEDAWGGLLRPAGNGDFLIVQTHGDHSSLLRLSAGGNVQWRHEAGAGTFSWQGDILALADGSVVQLQAGNTGYLSRISATGQAVWGLRLLAQQVVSSGSLLVTASCNGNTVYVTGVDAASGAVSWQRALATLPAPCNEVALAAGGDGIYVGHAAAEGGGQTLVRLNSQGQTVWSAAVASTARLTVNGSNLYSASQGKLWALRSSDGAVLWQSACSDTELHFVGADPLCRASYTSVRRLAATSGSQVWAHAVSGGSVLGVFEGNVYFRNDPVWQRWAGADGVSQWEKPLAAVSSYHPEVWRSTAGTIAFLSAPQNPDDYLLKRYRLSDGAEIGSTPLPSLQRSVSTMARVVDGADVFLYGEAASLTTPERVRRMGAAGGNLLWETGGASTDNVPHFALTDSRVYLAGVTGANSRVRSLERSGGATLWTRDAFFASAANVTWWPGLLTVASGDAVALNAFSYRPSPSGWEFQVVHSAERLASGDGAPVWSRNLTDWTTWDSPIDASYAPVGLAFGDELVLAPGSAGTTAHMPLQRVDAMTGAPLWSVSLSEGVDALARAVDEQAFFAFSTNHQAGARFSLSKYDAASGAELWRFSQDPPNGRHFELYKLLPLPGGDVLVVGNIVDLWATPPTTSGRVLRIKGDGSGLRYVWSAGTDPALSTEAVRDFVIDAAGQAWMYRQHNDRRLGLHFLARFDLEQGRVLGSQILRPFYVHPFFPITNWDLNLTPFQGEQFLSAGEVIRPPQPATQRIALRDFSVTRRGDLALDLLSLPASFQPNTTLRLTARVSYSGDGPIAGAVLVLDPPWQGTAGAFNCSGSGVSNCSVESRYGQIVARFDATPGARLELAGLVKSLVWPSAAAAVPRAIVYGPEGLLERDSGNNIRVVSASGPIFTDGFQ